MVCLDQWGDSLSPNPRIEEGGMKKGDRVDFRVITIALPRDSTGLLLKKYDYDNGPVWKVLVSHRGQATIRRIRQGQLRSIK